MKRALAECMIEGVATTVPFHLRLLDEPAYVRQQLSTTFVESWLAEQGAAGGARPGRAPEARARHGASTPLQQGIGSGQGDGW